MGSPSDCSQNRDPLILVREGTNRDQRMLPALSPDFAPVDEHGVANRIVFAQAYADLLNFFNLDDTAAGSWKPFFSTDLSVQLAVAAIQDVDLYRATVKGYLDFLKNLEPASDLNQAKEYLGFLFSIAATVARQLDLLKDSLPPDNAFRASLQNVIQSQLAPGFQRLIGYYKADLAAAPNSLIASVQPDLTILGSTTAPFSQIFTGGLSKDWITDASSDWNAYTAAVPADASVFGSGATELERINHIATHNLFTSVLDQFLKTYARLVNDAGAALQDTLVNYPGHQPHYALFLAFLRLLEEARKVASNLTARHLDFYYREILQLKEKPPQPGHAHLVVELAKQATVREFPPGELFTAGKDDLGTDAFFANDADFVANQGKVTSLKSVYRHSAEPVTTLTPADLDQDRIFASPAANSDDGVGAELTSKDHSWNPFNNKRYLNGKLVDIKMPDADLGFAIASHYLLMAEGTRIVTLVFAGAGAAAFPDDHSEDLLCSFTGPKGWITVPSGSAIFANDASNLILQILLTGADPPVVPYSPDTHGYNFATGLPILLVKLKHRGAKYFYPLLQDMQISSIDIEVDVLGIKTLTVSNDFGPVDTSKPFQPFGPSPVQNSSLVVGCKELFQKEFSWATLNVEWQATPAPYNGKSVTVTGEFLQGGEWHTYNGDTPSVTESSFLGTPASSGGAPFVDLPDLSAPEPYGTPSRFGFARLKLDADFGQADFQNDLVAYIVSVTNTSTTDDLAKPTPPVAPVATRLTLDYSAVHSIALDSSDPTAFESRTGYFFHLAPFGYAEQHPVLKSSAAAGHPILDTAIYLLPQLKHRNELDESLPKGDPVRHEGECYVGITGLVPPQNLSLLFEVADGTADPLSVKPHPHIQWSYLRGNEWIGFTSDEVQDATGELLRSGIVTFSVPRDATSDNTLLPAGQHWVRAAVATKSDAVCRLVAVDAQALQATFQDHGNDPAFPAKVLPAGTITKLDQPDADVKQISQPFPSFGGRGKELPADFYTRISERLRHKDRAIDLWDYEHLVLEAFPQVYKVKCLNHTQYDPSDSGGGTYRELAPGHVTVVTIPNLRYPSLRDPLKPYTSLGLLDDIATFLESRLSCFVTLHVRNPQFEEVKVSCKVRFYPGYDQSFFTQKLQEEVTRFLSPWAFSGGGSPTFGGKVYKAVLIDFIEELPYVDYLTDFLLFHSFQDENGADRVEEGDDLSGSKAVSILVSAASHDIAVLNPAGDQAPGEICPSLP
ncbi:hypothetical protein GMSM_17950 [Geomonas sp. Red276]